jgi:hypothetical protein
MSLRMAVSTLLVSSAVLAFGPAVLAQEDAVRQDDADRDGARTTSEVDGPLPRLGEVGPVTDAPEGLSLSPAVAEVPLTPGRRSEVVHVVANTTDAPLPLRLGVVPAKVGRDGPRLDGSSSSAVDDRATRLVVPVDRLRLAAGEGAELRSTAEVEAGHSLVVALLAVPETADDAGEEGAGDAAGAVAFVVLTDEEVASGLQVAAAEAESPGTLAEIALHTDRHAVVDVRVRVRSWLGVVHDQTTADLLVGPDEPRVLEVVRPAGSPPGRLHVEVVAVDRTGTEARATLATSAGAAGWLLVFAVALLTAAAVAVVVAARRLRSAASRAPAPAADPPPDEEPAP